jgi:hypothetical protein
MEICIYLRGISQLRPTTVGRQLSRIALVTSSRQQGRFPEEHGEKLKFVRRKEGSIQVTFN